MSADSEKDLQRRVDTLVCDEQTLRRLLWLHHGHSGPAIYGDDGEMQCHECPLDFRRDSTRHIEQRISRLDATGNVTKFALLE